MPEANESIAPFTLLGGILYLNEFELLPGLSADACRNIGRLRRKAVSAHLVGDRKTVVSCARQINRVVEADKRRRERLSSNQYVYARFGIQLPHPSGMQATVGTPVTDPQPGDLMANAGHAGIYIGNGLMIHAMNPVDGTKVTAVMPGMGYYRLLG